MKVFRGNIVHSSEQWNLQILEDWIIGVNENKIEFLKEGSEYDHILDQYGLSSSDVVTLQHGEFLMPGLVDTHIHASQYPNAGKALDLPLLEWLEKYTFKTEASFANPQLAYDIYRKTVRRVLRFGTTTACYFATIHKDSTLRLCDVVEEYGQRAYIGKVNMNQNSPNSYIESTKQSYEDTESYIKKVQERQNPLIEAVVTPRFAPNVTEPLMVQLGNLVKIYDVPVQTHISETKPECQWVKELYPKYDNYLDVYDKCGLVTNRTVLAHGIYLSDEELAVIHTRGAGVSHCPCSNTSLRSGLCDVRRLQASKVKVGLGTDVSGGYSPSNLESMRQCVQVSNVLAVNRPSSYSPLDFKDAFRLATIGGAEVLGLQDKIGNFSKGKEFDALLVTLNWKDSPIDLFPCDTTEDMVQKFIMLGDDRNIKEIYVAGQKIDI